MDRRRRRGEERDPAARDRLYGPGPKHGRDDREVGLITATQDTKLWVGGARAMQQSRLGDVSTLTLGLDVDGQRANLARAGAYLSGVGAVVLGLLVWMKVSAAPPHAVWYSLFGFRIQATGQLTGGGLGRRCLVRVGTPPLARPPL